MLDDEVGEKMGRGAPAGNFGVDDGKPPLRSTTLTRPSAAQHVLFCFIFMIQSEYCTIMYNRRTHNGYRGSLNYQSVFCYPHCPFLRDQTCTLKASAGGPDPF